MKVTAGPEMLDMLMKAAGPGAPAGGLSTLLPLLQGLGVNGSSGGTSMAALLPLLQMMGRQQQAPPEPAEAEAETANDTPPEEPRPEAPADEGGTREQSAGRRPRKSRRPRFAPDLSASAPALLQLLTGLGAFNHRPPAPPPPEPPPEDFDPCSLCPDPCPRRNAAISFDQVRALAATFPGYA